MTTPKILKAPDSIWLCYGDIIQDEVHEQDGDNITWCEMAQDNADVKYIRADIVDKLRNHQLRASEIMTPKPCPFCGKSDTLVVISGAEFNGD